MTLEEIVEVLALVELMGQTRHSNVVIPCPFAPISGHKHQFDHNPSLGFLPKDDEYGAIWNCFACGRKGHVRSFFEDLQRNLGVDVSKVDKRLDEILAIDPAAYASALPKFDSALVDDDELVEEKGMSEEGWKVFPESWVTAYAGRAPTFLLERRISIETCRAFGIGWDAKAGRAVFPVRDHKGRLAGAVGGQSPTASQRRPHEPKYKNYWARLCCDCEWPLDHRDGRYRCPSCDRTVSIENAVPGFRKASFLYGEHLFKDDPYGCAVVVVEGIVDMLRVYQATRGWKDGQGDYVLPVAVFGSAPSSVQAEKIVELAGKNKVIALFDDDEAGAKGAEELRLLVGSRMRYFRCYYEEVRETRRREGAYGDLDPGQLTDGDIRRLIGNAKAIAQMRHDKKAPRRRKR